jgi:hypothetical protein
MFKKLKIFQYIFIDFRLAILYKSDQKFITHEQRFAYILSLQCTEFYETQHHCTESHQDLGQQISQKWVKNVTVNGRNLFTPQRNV